MAFAVCEYAHRPFEHVHAELCHDPSAVLQEATDAVGTKLRVEAEAMLMAAEGMAATRVTWRTPEGLVWVEGELRLLGVSPAPEPGTELLLVAEQTAQGVEPGTLVTWAHHVLGRVAGHTSDREAARPPHLHSRLLDVELARRGG